MTKAKPTPLKRAQAMARAGGLNPDTMSAADYLDKLGIEVEGLEPVNSEAWEVPAAEPEDPFTVSPEEQAAFARKATSSERHGWLENAATFLRPIVGDAVKEAGGELPELVRVTISWPFASRKAIGQCWHAEASREAVREVFVSPQVDDTHDVLGVLAHEMIHAGFGKDEKHGKNFGKAARAIGLEGKLTATVPGETFKQSVSLFIEAHGHYPAKGLDPALIHKKQTTRLLKCECEECGYIARVAKAWIERAGPPLCPVDEIPMMCDAV